MRSRELDSIAKTVAGSVGPRNLPLILVCLCVGAPFAGAQETPPALSGVWSTTVTTNIAEDNLAIHNSDQASSIERYSLSHPTIRGHTTSSTNVWRSRVSSPSFVR